jgi:NAD(P)-dependent dehydrogenase (short-subunit alcohol dehydrogenase family)
MLEVNVVGALATTQAFLPLLRARRGRVVMIGSIAGLVAFPLRGAYCASKFALEGLTDVLRLELKASGIQVTMIEPGAVATPIWSKGGAEADRLQEGLSASARQELDERYGPMLSAGRESARQSAARGLPPDSVAAVVESVLLHRRPPARVVVGRDARAIRLLNALLPVRRLDRMRLRWSGQRA